MKKQFDFFTVESYFRYEKRLIVPGNMYIGKKASINELVVEGDCFIEDYLFANKVVVYGNLIANTICAKELEVYGDSDINNLSGHDLKFAHKLKVNNAKLMYANLIVGEIIEANFVTMEYADFSIGKLTCFECDN